MENIYKIKNVFFYFISFTIKRLKLLTIIYLFNFQPYRKKTLEATGKGKGPNRRFLPPLNYPRILKNEIQQNVRQRQLLLFL